MPAVRNTLAGLGFIVAMASGGGIAQAALPIGYNPPPPPPPPPCAPGYHREPPRGPCIQGPHHSPVLSIDLARQSPDRNLVHLVGWSADADAPTTPVSISVSIDGSSATTVSASEERDDVAAAYPQYGKLHGYDLSVSAGQSPHQVCVTAHDLGGTSADTTHCQQIDDVTKFDATDIDYDTTHATRTATTLEQLDEETQKNQTKAQQSTTISGQEVVTDTSGWSDTEGVKVDCSLQIGVPSWLSDSKATVSVEGSVNFTQNGSEQVAHTWSWSQPMIVPAMSKVQASVAVEKTTLTVPYMMNGNWVYASGYETLGSVSGTYTGINSHDLSVDMEQYTLDGTPAAKPAVQPAAKVSES